MDWNEALVGMEDAAGSAGEGQELPPLLPGDVLPGFPDEGREVEVPSVVVDEVGELVDHNPQLGILIGEAVEGKAGVGGSELEDENSAPWRGEEPNSHGKTGDPPDGGIVLHDKLVRPIDDTRGLGTGLLPSILHPRHL